MASDSQNTRKVIPGWLSGEGKKLLYPMSFRVVNDMVTALDMYADRYRETLDTAARRNASSGVDDPGWHNILVGGAAAAGTGLRGLSELPFGVLSKGKGNNELYRFNEWDKIRAAIDKATSNNKKVRVFGHSYGGATVANIAKDYPNVPVYALDPVGWFDRLDKIPKNLTIVRPDPGYVSTRDGIVARLAPLMGGRWPILEDQKERYMLYDGGHVSGVDLAVNKIVNNNRTDSPKTDVAKSNADMKRRRNIGPMDWSLFIR
jgi:pimeloyl-ACP methyl ester carboxylesterase